MDFLHSVIRFPIIPGVRNHSRVSNSFIPTMSFPQPHPVEGRAAQLRLLTMLDCRDQGQRSEVIQPWREDAKERLTKGE